MYYLSIGGRPCNVTVFEATTGLTVLYPRKRRRPCCCRHRTRHLEPDRSSSKQQTRGIGRQCRFCTSWAGLLLSTIVNASIDITRDQTADSTDCVAWACCKRFKPGLYAGVRVCEVDSRPGAVLRPAHHVYGCVRWTLDQEQCSDRHTTTSSSYVLDHWLASINDKRTEHLPHVLLYGRGGSHV